MLSRLPLKEKKAFSAIVFACSDALCTPKHGVREFLQQNGIANADEYMIHSIREPGGIHNVELHCEGPFDRERLFQLQLGNIGIMIGLKKANVVVIDGHNPCGACGHLKIDVSKQRELLAEFAARVYEKFGVTVVALLEDHDDHDHKFEVIEAYGIGPKAMAAE